MMPFTGGGTATPERERKRTLLSIASGLGDLDGGSVKLTNVIG
jgi:hypothetical protein